MNVNVVSHSIDVNIENSRFAHESVSNKVATMEDDNDDEDIIKVEAVREIFDILTVVYDRCGMDFRDYAPSSLIRRIRRRILEEGLSTVAELRRLIDEDPGALNRLLNSLTLSVTSMFRDPSFFRMFREQVCPTLATYPFLRIWIAGCSSGQEAYSLAILLEEIGLYERSRIYATDLHPGVLQQAQSGIYPLAAMQEYTRHYQAAGGSRAFTEYYVADAEYAILRPSLRTNMIFAQHNLVCDQSFNEFHVILCRNVMIYFNDALQNRAHKLMYDSLVRLGYLGVGRSESIRFSLHESDYETVSKTERIYRKIR